MSEATPRICTRCHKPLKEDGPNDDPDVKFIAIIKDDNGYFHFGCWGNTQPTAKLHDEIASLQAELKEAVEILKDIAARAAFEQSTPSGLHETAFSLIEKRARSFLAKHGGGNEYT